MRLTSLVLVLPRNLQVRQDPANHKSVSELLDDFKGLQLGSKSMKISFVIAGGYGHRDKHLLCGQESAALHGMLQYISNRGWKVERAKNTRSGG